MPRMQSSRYSNCVISMIANTTQAVNVIIKPPQNQVASMLLTWRVACTQAVVCHSVSDMRAVGSMCTYMPRSSTLVGTEHCLLE